MPAVSVAIAGGCLRELIEDNSGLLLREFVDTAAAADDLGDAILKLGLRQFEPFSHRHQELHLLVAGNSSLPVGPLLVPFPFVGVGREGGGLVGRST
ncbi:hypothetical protein [Fimbriiglobus ruber]|uniref:hypothetical protein n=1 Tax=Fimbriiglobus ruber TaxID=1908690 RepID=UPI001179C4B7|nr:hypothetical protein [Fimbriiglobus ruber]